MRVRPLVDGDRDAVDAVLVDAFGEEGATIVRLVERLREAGVVLAEHVAEDEGGDVVGHVALSRSWLDARQQLVEVPVLSPLSVRPDHQRRGTGAALLAAAVRTATTSGAPAVFLEGDPAYYGRRGWLRASELGFERPSERIPEPAFQVLPLPAREGWMTGRVVYAEAFWELDCVGLRDPLLASLEERFRHE